MASIPINIAEHVGRTPMVQLTRLVADAGADVFAKLEMFNPGGSVKDRIGVAMIEAAEAEGRIEPGRTTIVVRPGSIRPSRSAASIIATPIRSLTEPPGLSISSLAKTSPRASSPSSLVICTMGVRPT